MAGIEDTIKIILEAEDRRASTVIAGVGKTVEDAGEKLGELNDSVASMTQPFADMAGAVVKADTALAAMAVGGLAYAFAKSSEFESATVELQKVLGDFPDMLSSAQTEAKALSDTYGQSASTILGSMADFKQAGFEMADAMELSKSALDLVIAGNIDASTASDLLVASLKGFGEPASEAARLVDILNEVSNNYATDVRQLAIGMAELSPIASTMGFSMEETAGVLTPVIEIFRSGGEAAVALKTGLLRLLDDNPTVVKALESIGVAQRDSNGELRSGKDILGDVAQAFTTLDQNQKLFVASQLVGIDQSARMVTVFDNLGKTSEVTATAMESAGSAAKEVAARLESSETAVDRFKVGFVNLAVVIGDQFRDAAKEAVNGGTEITRALSGIVESGALDELFDALETQFSALGRHLSDVAKSLPEAIGKVDFSAMLKAIGGVGNELEGLFDGLDLRTPEGLAQAIQLAVDSIKSLANVTSGMIDGAEPFLQLLFKMVDGFTSMSDESQEAVGKFLGFTAALNLVTGPVGAVFKALEGLGGVVKALAGGPITSLVSSLLGGGGLSAAFSGAATAAGGLLSALAGPAGVIAVFAASGTAIYGAASGFLAWRDAEKEAEQASNRAADSAEKLAEKYRQISDATGVQIGSTQDLKQAMEDGKIVFDEATKTWKAAGDVQRDYAAEVEAAKGSSYSLQKVTEDLAKSMGLVTDETETATGSFDSQRQAAIDAAAAYYEFLGNPPEIAKRMAELEASRPERVMEKVADATEEATKKTESFILGMEKIKSEERVKTFEISVDFKIAQLEAETKKFQSVMDSIDNTMTSTGQLLGSLFGELNNAGSRFDANKIQSQIDAENDRRDEAHKMSMEMSQVQLDLAKAKLDAVNRGEALIKISADGLEPEIEAFMWQILERIQIRVAEEASELLIGI